MASPLVAPLPGPAVPSPLPPGINHLSPHDIVTYFRCPQEMEIHRRQRESWRSGRPLGGILGAPGPGLLRSPLPPPPLDHLVVFQGRLDVFSGDTLIYEDPDERNLPILFPPAQNHAHAFLHDHSPLLHDPAWDLAGRPDLVIRRRDGSLVPVEYKETHLWERYHEVHGRVFDVIQALAECRLVEATWQVRPRMGIVYYGDTQGDGTREGWMEIPYGDRERGWLEHALTQIRSDPERRPVPSDHTCPTCEVNRDGLCPSAKFRYEGLRGAGPRPGAYGIPPWRGPGRFPSS